MPPGRTACSEGSNDRFGVAFRKTGIFREPGKAAVPLSGTRAGPAHHGLWVESCHCLIWFGNALRAEHLQDRKVALGPF